MRSSCAPEPVKFHSHKVPQPQEPPDPSSDAFLPDPLTLLYSPVSLESIRGGVRGHFVAMGPDRAMSVEYMTLPFFYTFGHGNTAFLGASTLAQWKLFQSPA